MSEGQEVALIPLFPLEDWGAHLINGKMGDLKLKNQKLATKLKYEETFKEIKIAAWKLNAEFWAGSI